MGRSVFRSLFVFGGIALGATAAGVVEASQASGWWGGSWACTIDGRPARMKWDVVDAGGASCSDDGGERVCSTTSAVRWRGRFSDNGAPWASLADPRLGNQGGMFFTHADGNRWYLAKPVGGRSRGWTTWNRQRYPLSCRRQDV